MPTPKNPFEAKVDSLSGADFSLVRDAVEARRCRELVGAGDHGEAADKWRPRPACTGCGSERTVGRGRTGAGHRYRECLGCGHRLASLSGTIFESAKKAFWRWVLFVRLMCFDVQLDAFAELCGITHQTAWEWRHGVMATIDGCQDGIVPRDKVWTGEMYVTDSDLKGDPGRRPRRGPGRSKICIAVATGVHRNVVAVRCGHGKPSAKRTKDAMLSHIAEGSEGLPRHGGVA